jgi:hypothetical protein
MPSDDPKTLLLDGFDKAFVGGLRKFGQSVPIAVYDYDKVMEIVMSDGDLDEDDAAEHIEFNILGGYLGEGTPCMLFPCSLREFIDECGEDIDPAHTDRDTGDEDPNAYPDEEGMTEKERVLYRQAINDFCLNFIRYVKETNPSVYSLARDYAKDYSGNSVVEFVDVKEEEKP